MKNVLTPLTKSFPIPLGLTAAASATDGTIQKKFMCIRHDYNDNFKQRNGRHHESDLLTKGASETIENEEKGKKGGFLEHVIRYIKY